MFARLGHVLRKDRSNQRLFQLLGHIEKIFIFFLERIESLLFFVTFHFFLVIFHHLVHIGHPKGLVATSLFVFFVTIIRLLFAIFFSVFHLFIILLDFVRVLVQLFLFFVLLQLGNVLLVHLCVGCQEGSVRTFFFRNMFHSTIQFFFCIIIFLNLVILALFCGLLFHNFQSFFPALKSFRQGLVRIRFRFLRLFWRWRVGAILFLLRFGRACVLRLLILRGTLRLLRRGVVRVL
mmetsp:Transcript_7969/g.15217  ORF Transcript_7969/g.15217 Transcript_7969/m.15217 type:complete len:235 (-) Transcript_7969:1821-2525(-)